MQEAWHGVGWGADVKARIALHIAWSPDGHVLQAQHPVVFWKLVCTCLPAVKHDLAPVNCHSTVPLLLAAPCQNGCCGWQAMGAKKARQLTFDPPLTPEDQEYLRKLPFTLSMPSHGVCVVHAGFVPGVPIQQQSLEDMIEVGASRCLPALPVLTVQDEQRMPGCCTGQGEIAPCCLRVGSSWPQGRAGECCSQCQLGWVAKHHA